jgi:hypothetical protein
MSSTGDIAPEPFGPWRTDIDPVERRCRWRALIAHVYVGPDSELALAARDADVRRSRAPCGT